MKKIIFSTLAAFVFFGNTYAEDPQNEGTMDTSSKPELAPLSTMSCNYRVPTEIENVSTEAVMAFAKYAALRSFSFAPDQIDTAMKALEPCYTPNGWKAFSKALHQSGNLKAIEKEKLNMSSQLSGKPTIEAIKNNEWKLSLPITVLYKNDKNQLVQHLTLDIRVGRKLNGDLGVMQIIGTAHKSQ